MKFTVLGASGHIGGRLRSFLEQRDHEVYAPPRDDPHIYSRDLGHAIYCIGVTADFRRKPFETIAAHVTVLAEVLRRASFDSLLYLSSTRVYLDALSTDESADCRVNSSRPDDFYNLTKLAGEALCFACGRKNVRVARLSNVFSVDAESENFLTELVRDALQAKQLTVRTSLDSAKDYIAMADVLELLTRIAVAGTQSLYNVASGANISNRALVERLAGLTGCQVTVAPGAPVVVFPPISIARIKQEFFSPASDVLAELPRMLHALKTSTW
jgi:nucleoside-diphosphate-sugar epimerase